MWEQNTLILKESVYMYFWVSSVGLLLPYGCVSSSSSDSNVSQEGDSGVFSEEQESVGSYAVCYGKGWLDGSVALLVGEGRLERVHDEGYGWEPIGHGLKHSKLPAWAGVGKGARIPGSAAKDQAVAIARRLVASHLANR